MSSSIENKNKGSETVLPKTEAEALLQKKRIENELATKRRALKELRNKKTAPAFSPIPTKPEIIDIEHEKFEGKVKKALIEYQTLQNIESSQRNERQERKIEKLDRQLLSYRKKNPTQYEQIFAKFFAGKNTFTASKKEQLTPKEWSAPVPAPVAEEPKNIETESASINPTKRIFGKKNRTPKLKPASISKNAPEAVVTSEAKSESVQTQTETQGETETKQEEKETIQETKTTSTETAEKSEEEKPTTENVSTTPETKPAPEPSPKPAPKPEFSPLPEEYDEFKNTFIRKHIRDGMADLAIYAEKDIPGFTDLSSGQKMLVLEKLTAKLHSEVKTGGREKFNEINSDLSGFSGGVKKIWNTVRKNYLTKKYEKETLQSLTGNERGKFMNTIGGELATTIKETGLEARFENGEVHTNYIPEITAENEISTEISKRYNERADALSKIPYEWTISDATPKQKAAYKQALEQFKVGKYALLKEVTASAEKHLIENPRIYAAEQISKSETSIKFMQFLSENPKASDQLRKIATQSALAGSTKDILVQRAGSMAMGAGSKAAFTALSGAGILAAPIVASVMGFYRGKARAKESLVTQNKLAREGVRQKGQTAFGMGNVERRIERLTHYTNLLQQAQNPIEQEKLKNIVKTHTDFIEQKLSLGQINFGEKENRITRQYELMQSLQAARMSIEVQKNQEVIFENYKTWNNLSAEIPSHDIRALVEKIGATHQKRTQLSREKLVRRQAIQSAFYGGMFATAGMAISHYAHEFGWFGAAKHSGATPVASPAKEATDIKDTLHTGSNSHSMMSKVVTSAKETASTNNAHHGAATSAFTKETIPHEGLAKGEGGIQAVINFKHSAEFQALSPENKKIFEGNPVEVARRLHLFNPEAQGHESMIMHPGDHITVDQSGNAYIVGKDDIVRPLGNGESMSSIAAEHTPVPSEALAPNGANPSEYVPASSDVAHHELVQETLPPTPHRDMSAKEIVELIGQKTPQAPKASFITLNDFTDKSPDVLDQAKNFFKGVPIEEYEIPADVSATLTEHANQNITNILNSYFGKFDALTGNVVSPGESSYVWKTFSSIPAQTVLKQDPQSFLPEYRGFISEIQKMAKEDSIEPGTLKVGDYLKKLFLHQEKVQFFQEQVEQ